MSSVSTYAALQAKVRARYSELLGGEELIRLSEAADFPALVAQLKQTVYGPLLDQVPEANLVPRRTAYRIRMRLAQAYASMISVAPKTAERLLLHMYRRFEVDNLKGVLRGVVTGASWDVINFVLFPLTASVIPAREMAESGSVAEAVELLRGTQYYDYLSYALRRFSTEHSIFPLEVAIDLEYWRRLWSEIGELSGPDKTHAMNVLGGLLDFNNLMWAIRYRVYYNLSEEELINYTLPFGNKVRDEKIRAIAAGADIAAVVSQIYHEIRDVQQMLQNPTAGLPRLESELQRELVAACHSEFLGYPFHIGLVLAYLILLEMEIKDLTVLIEAKSTGAPREEFLPLLVTAAVPA